MENKSKKVKKFKNERPAFWETWPASNRKKARLSIKNFLAAEPEPIFIFEKSCKCSFKK
jgi:hypothetical protein